MMEFRINCQRIFISIVFVGLLISGCTGKKDPGSVVEQLPSEIDVRDTTYIRIDSLPLQSNNSRYQVKTYKNDPPLTGYGYDIFLDGKMYVHQPSIPAIQGNRGF